MIVIVPEAPAATIGMTHWLLPDVAAGTEPTNVVPAGYNSLMTTLYAAPVPVFVYVIVYVIVAPALTCAVAVFVTVINGSAISVVAWSQSIGWGSPLTSSHATETLLTMLPWYARSVTTTTIVTLHEPPSGIVPANQTLSPTLGGIDDDW